jgi:type II secretory pathway pseudopilin PulG
LGAEPIVARPGERGLTLLEVVIALLLFALMSMLLLSGQARASEAVLRAEIEREMAELLRLRIDLVMLEYEKYREGSSEGGFPGNVSNHIVDEEELLAGWQGIEGYRWEVVITETLGAGAQGNVEVEGGDTYEPLFAEEAGSSAEEDTEADVVQPEEIDRMLFIHVTVYPPGYDDQSDDDRDLALQPRSAWTAIHLPNEEED